ncbi:hypothetical protein PROFUN_13373 [Planoprotostelium fungivorum]|uniref:AB hydrolase-1 domain-containing protein n=1 Tax=Planoprotostelium fungivorum TaxID=1890364 RepID=A0A2P6MZR3_9EUKA|nr:hypothetical protein PROFUN_13373 [Planoprotostelium fungivorum]
MSVCIATAPDPDTFVRTEEFIRREIRVNRLGNGLSDAKESPNTSVGNSMSIQRIPKKGALPVILQHGLLDTTASWVINSRKTSLGFILADAGYDVWLVNGRGNSYSGEPNGWDWTFDDQALDLSYIISHVNTVTNTTPIVVAHSQGATTSLLALSSNAPPSIRGLIALGPVTYLHHQTSPLFSIMAKLRIDVTLSILPSFAFGPTQILLNSALGTLCKVTPSVCDVTLSGLFGKTENLNDSRMGVYTAHWPDVTSSHNMAHWIRNARSGDFSYYGGESVDISRIHTKVAVFVGTRDSLGDPRDAARLVQTVKGATVTTVEGYAHMDFVWAENAAELVYPQVLEKLEEFSI